MHVGDQAIAQIGDLLRKHLPPNSVRGAHLRRPLRGRHALGDRRGGDVRRRPARGRHATIYRARRRALPPVDQPRRHAVQRPRRRSRPFARRGRVRLQGGQGPRPQSPRDLPGKRRQHHPPVHRHQRRHRRARRARGEPPAPRSADDPAVRRRRPHAKPHYEMLLRMLDPEGNTHRAGPFPVRGAALPDDADHRPLGDLERHRAAAPAARAAGQGAGGLHHQFLGPVAAPTRNSPTT